MWRESGKKVDFTSWAHGEPSNEVNADCLELQAITDFRWNDLKCRYSGAVPIAMKPLCQASKFLS